MNAFEERTRSLWMEITVAEASRLESDIETDAVIIGSGIAGLSTAYELSRRGQRVVVIDRGRIGGGMTARTSAHLTAESDDSFKALTRMRGLEGAKTFYQSHAAAIDRIETIQRDEGIACNFRRVDAFMFPTQEDTSALQDEFEATRAVGMPIEWQDGLPLKGLGGARCLRYPRQATFHPTLYLQGLAGAILKRGGRLFADTPAMRVEESEGEVSVKTEDGQTIKAANAVVATNSPMNERFALHSKQAPYRTYVVCFEIPRESIDDALYWDMLDPYHYVRFEPRTDDAFNLLVGGEDHKTGEADDGEARFEKLEAWSRGLWPNAGKVTHRWSGQVLEPVDHAAFSGRNPNSNRIYVHTGDSGQGLTHGVAGSLLIAQLIAGEDAPWKDFYEPSRITLSATNSFLAENVTALKSFAEYVAPGELASVKELKAGQGAIIREGLTKVAAYRAQDGQLYRRSAACTHTGCHIHWNTLESTWDCPCHGSHFAPDGSVLNAPAIFPLKKVESKHDEA